MKKIKLAIGVILVFLVGAFAGALGSGMYLKHRMEKFAAGGPDRIAMKSRLINRLSSALELSAAQKLEIEKVIDEQQARMSRVRRQYLPEIRDIADQSLIRIRETLNPDQVEKLDKLRRRLKPWRPPIPAEFGLLSASPEAKIRIMGERLQLTPEQALAVRRILEAQVAKRQEIREMQREGEIQDIGSLRRQMVAHQRSLEKRLAETLSEQQMEEYKKMVEEERLKRYKKRMKVDNPSQK